MRVPETPGGSQKVACNVVEEVSCKGAASADHGIPPDCLYQRMTDQTVRMRCWEKKGVVGTA